MDEFLQGHYSQVSSHYGKDWTHTDEFRNPLFQKMGQVLDIQPEDKVVDLGAGTCSQTLSLYERFPTTTPYLCVEPSHEMLAQAPSHKGLELLELDGMKFSTLEKKYNKMIMIGVIHHFKEEELLPLFQNFYQQLEPSGKILIITRPHEPHFPYFESLKTIWMNQQPHYSIFLEKFIEAGFAPEVSFYPHQVKLTREEWIEFIQLKSWSTFSLLTDQQMAEGLQQLRDKFSADSIIEFADEIVFVCATKN